MKQSRWIGQTLNGRYKIEEILGQGGMSSVYKATDPNLRRVVAIKMVHPHLSSDPSFMRRFEEEAAAIGSLRHPNIVQVFDFNSDEDVNYMVMEYVPGETLQARLHRLNKNQRKMAITEAVQITMNVCDGLSYAHKRGMVHRDVKPGNIMLDIQNQAILMDFGIVKIVGSSAHTLTGAVIGTANYMPPEIIRSEPADQRSDIYALGVTLYEMLSGKPPFDADSAMTIMMMHLNDPVPDIEKIRDDLPGVLVTILKKALEKGREERYQSAEEMANDLRKVSQKLSTLQLDKPEVLLNQTEEKEMVTPTQIVPQVEVVDLNATLIDIPEQTLIHEETQAPVVEKQVKKIADEKFTNKPKANKKLWGIFAGFIIIISVLIIGFTTSWFGLARNILTEKPTSKAVDLAAKEQASNEISPISPLPTENVAQRENIKETEISMELEQENFLVCQITDNGSIASSPFLETAFIGLGKAENELGVRIAVLESNDQDQYEMNLNQFIDMNCNLIISVGYMLGDITIQFAESHPDKKFSIIDFQENNDLPNLKNQVYQIDQASFLAGYLAAAMTETGKVATYGGMPIPPVEMFMDGFARGVLFYNERKAQNVQLIGWDINNRTGIFVDSFDNFDIGVEMANEFISQNIDIIYPVAGSVGLGSAAIFMERGSGLIIGVDSDWAISYPEFAPVILTSTIKRLDKTVFGLIEYSLTGNFSGENLIGNLENEGVGLAPFHEFDSIVPEEIKVELQEIREQILSGAIEFNPVYHYE